MAEEATPNKEDPDAGLLSKEGQDAVETSTTIISLLSNNNSSSRAGD